MPFNPNRSFAAKLDTGAYVGSSRTSGTSRVRASERICTNVHRPRRPLRQCVNDDIQQREGTTRPIQFDILVAVFSPERLWSH